MDCGYGIGRWGYLLKKKHCIVGIDIYKPYLKKAKMHRSYSGLILGDISHLPFKARSFDTILAIEVIEHLPKNSGELFLRQLKKVARQRIILTPPRNYETTYFGEAHPETHKSYWTREEIITYLSVN